MSIVQRGVREFRNRAVKINGRKGGNACGIKWMRAEPRSAGGGLRVENVGFGLVWYDPPSCPYGNRSATIVQFSGNQQRQCQDDQTPLRNGRDGAVAGRLANAVGAAVGIRFTGDT